MASGADSCLGISPVLPVSAWTFTDRGLTRSGVARLLSTMETQGVGPGADAVTSATRIESDVARQPAVPFWYWGALAALFGVEVFAVTTGLVAIISVTSLLILFAGRGLNAVLASRRGIRIGRVFGGAGSWLAAPWFVSLIGLCVLGSILTAQQGAFWPGVAAGMASVVVTLAFGFSYDRARLRRASLLPR